MLTFMNDSRHDNASRTSSEANNSEINVARAMIRILISSLALGLVGCHGPVAGLFPAEQDAVTVHVASYGYHADLVIPTDQIDPTIWPAYFGADRKRFLAVGWGDRGFYTHPDASPDLWTTSLALFFPTPTVMHVLETDRPIDQQYRGYDRQTIQLSRTGFDLLCAHVRDGFNRQPSGDPIRIGQGLWPDSLFYEGSGFYMMPFTCNTWCAQALRAAGCPITPIWAVTRENIMWQIDFFDQ